MIYVVLITSVLFRNKYWAIQSTEGFTNMSKSVMDDHCRHMVSKVGHIHSIVPSKVKSAIEKLKIVLRQLFWCFYLPVTSHVVQLNINLTICFSVFFSHGLSSPSINILLLVRITKKMQGIFVNIRQLKAIALNTYY